MYSTNSLFWILRQERELRGIFLRDEYRKRRDNFLMALARRLPKRLVMFCFLRVSGHASSGKYSTQIIPELSAMDAIGRFMKDNRLY